MKRIDFEKQFESLLAENAIDAAEDLIRKHAAVADDKETTAPFSAPVKMMFETPQGTPVPEGEGIITWANNYCRRVRNARYRRMIQKNPDRLRILDEGDSWTQYPIFLEELVDQYNRKFASYSLSAAGDTLENMVLEGEYKTALRREDFDVFLISGGGNDLLGYGNFVRYLNRYESGASTDDLINRTALDHAMNRILDHYRDIIGNAVAIRPNLKIFLHGYGNVHPRKGGKWLGKPLRSKGIPTKLWRNITTTLIGEFNTMLAALAKTYPNNVTYFDLRQDIGEAASTWEDEIHPKSKGFMRAARQIVACLKELENDLPKARNEVASAPEVANLGQLDFPDGKNLLRYLRDLISPPEPTLHSRPISSSHPTHEIQAAQRVLAELLGSFEQAEHQDRIDTRIDYTQTAGQPTLERILGHNDLDESYVLEMGNSASRSVARLHVRYPEGGAGFGTGFLIGDGLLITNNHVIPTKEAAAQTLVSFGHEYGKEQTPINAVHFRLTDEVFLTSQSHDYTIVKVSALSQSNEDLQQFGHIEMLPRSGKALKRECINIIQHPNGDYKKVALRDNLLIDRHDQFLYYATDTDRGSSGSPLFNREWQLVGIHHMAIPHPRHPDTFIANRGVRISAIIDDIARKREAGSSDAKLIDAILLSQRTKSERYPFSNVAQISDNNNKYDDEWAEVSLDAPIAVPLPEASRARLSVRDASWPQSPRNAPDTWHLPAETADDSFSLTPALLQIMVETNAFKPDSSATGKVIFGLRGARLSDNSQRAEDVSSINVTTARVDHENNRCLMGVWDVTSGRIWAYQASTVPRRTGMLGHYNRINFGQDRMQCNLLPTGCYEYCVGSHYSARNGEVTYVLRQGNGPARANASTVTTLRTENDLIYGTRDVWDKTKPCDNIHPAFRSSSFSSNGCLTLPGSQNAGGASYTTGSGDWHRFRAAAGFDGRNLGVRYDLVLLTGHEAASFEKVHLDTANYQELRCYRHGSYGGAVRQLQGFLGVAPDSFFGPVTKLALTKKQHEILGYSTGTYTPEMARLLFGMNANSEAVIYMS